MRAFSYILVACSVLLFASAGYDQFRGRTSAPSGGRYSAYARYPVTREDRPEEFRNAMTSHWFFATLILVAGAVMYSIYRGQERADPASSDYAGSKAIDEWGEELKQEEERRQGPKG